MSLVNGIKVIGEWCNIYLSTPAQVRELRNTLRNNGVRVSYLIRQSNKIVGLNAKISESTALTYVNSIKK